MAIVATVIQRIIAPAIYTACILCRPVALSIPYLIFLFYTPFVPVATARTIRGHTGYFYKLAIAITSIILVSQIAFEIVLFVKGSQFLQSCEFLELLFRHIGMIKLNDVTLSSICLWFLPDVSMFVVNLIAFIVLRKITLTEIDASIEEAEPSQNQSEFEICDENTYSPEQYDILKRTAIICAMTTILFAAYLQPSAPGAIYFIVFLLTATVWASFKEIDRGFAIICRLLLVLLVFHISALLAYQTPWPQTFLDANNTIIRFAGFSPLIISSCFNATDGDIRVIYLNSTIDLDAFLNPIALILCYYTLTISSRFILDAKLCYIERRSGAFGQYENGAQHITRQVSKKIQKSGLVRKRLAKESWHGAADKVRLMRRSMKRLKTFKQTRRSEGSITDGNNIPLENIGGDDVVFTEEESPPTISEHISFAIGHLTDLICKHSYVISNIAMMVWSIFYHSWLTFVFLIVANLLWIIPNQRKNMHRISPFVVVYAEFLLITQYLYCMNLTEDELPTHVDTKGINLAQIGFIRYRTYPCIPLLLKTLFTMTFWLTLRQMKYENTLDRQTSTLAHLAAPFHVTVSAATTDLGPKTETKKSKIMMKAGAIFKSLLTQIWIWIVIFAMFFFAIYGKEVTVFRIVYMSLFLIFVITFQISWRVWKRMMFTFWIVVIGFSMLSLIMIYTYQFDRFEDYWEKYVGIKKTLQEDIGLVKYGTKILFLHLFYPTLLVILTVVQLQMFHTKYLESLELPSLTDRDNIDIQPSSSVNYGSLEPNTISEEQKEIKSRHIRLNVSDLKNLTTKQALKKAFLFYKRTKWFFDIFWLFLELHFIKVIMLLAFLLSVNEVAVIHSIIIVLSVIGVTARTNSQTVYSGIISLVVGVLFVLKMIYQIKYIDQSIYNVNCNHSSNGTANITLNDPHNNTANWLGFTKLIDNHTLMELLSDYIGYIVALTVYNLILLYQQRKRFLNGKSIARPKVLFPKISRNDADKDLLHLIKYLFNFAFYKFGVELTMMMLVVLISYRLDVIALIYTIWLSILFGVSRGTKYRIWSIFQWFIVVLIVLQYVLVVDLPPPFCTDYPWKLNHRLQEVAWLPDPTLRNHVSRLILDFILLMCTCRQMLVFRIEKQYEGNEFIGGSNKSVVEDINKLGTGDVPIQTHDFVSTQKTWLDIIKCIVFLGCFWITLAIVFLAGTNRMNIFSIGYLLGSFIFLWQGADFYLRPIHTILRWWKYLVAYNIFVITMKIAIYIPVFVFINFFKDNPEDACFLKIFGITCAQNSDKFAPPPKTGCDVPNEELSLVWDCACFMFLIFQLRIFQSYYFCHIINESKASTILASRGAELIESLRRKQVKIQAQREEEILQKIKQKMDRIKANQKKIQPTMTAPKTHFEDNKTSGRSKPIITHQRAVRSGDYYLFEDLDEKVELELLHERPSAGIDDAMTDRKMSDKMTIEQVLTSTFQATPPKRKHPSETSCEEETDRHQISLPAQRISTSADKSFADAKSTVSEPIRKVSKVTVGSDSTSSRSPQNEFIQPDDEKPSTSRQDDDESEDPDDLSDPLSSTGTDRPEPGALSFVTAFISGVLVSLTLRLYKLSRNYRYATRILCKEKKELKQENGFGQGNRAGTGRIWAPLPSVLRTQGQSSSSSTSSSLGASTQQIESDSEILNSESYTNKGTDGKGTTIAHLLKPQLFPTKEERRPSDDNIIKDFSDGDDDFYSQRHSILTEFCQSLWFALISNTDLICYLLVFINMVKSQSLLALPMPLMVFLWGTLSVPRPSKTFWVSLIAYIQVVVLIKCIAPLFWLNSNSIVADNQKPMAFKRIIGIEIEPHYTTWDLILLLVIFFHRFVQKQMGIWKAGYGNAYAVNAVDPTLAKTTVAIENEAAGSTIAVSHRSCVINEDNERDKLVQFESPDESAETQKYFSSVSANIRNNTKYCSPFMNFVRDLLTITDRVSADVYTYIFLCDFVNFFVLLFGFTAFGSSQGDGGVTSYLEENKIPIAFLIMLLLQFIFIIIDRALYLKKHLLGKIVFQLVSVVLMHIWLFFLVPVFSERRFNEKLPPVLYYCFKYIYFLLSAYQIRCAYPTRILGNCLTKGFTMFHLAAFKIYMQTPFLFELRALMDWIWTDSTMPLFEWLKMEDIFANVFELKCSRQMEKDFPTPRGEAKKSFSKYMMGGGYLIAIIALAWGPLALFALGNTVGEPNIPYEVSASLRVGPYEPVYIMSAQSSQIHKFSDEEFIRFQKSFPQDRAAQTFLSNYEANDIAAVFLGANSTSLWNISPPDLERLKSDLANNETTIKVRYKYSVSRITYSEKMPSTISAEQSFDIVGANPIRKGLLSMLNRTANGTRVVMSYLFPKFLKVKNLGDLKPAHQLFLNSSETADHFYSNLSLILHENNEEKWWEVLEECDKDNLFCNNILKHLPQAKYNESAVMYTFSDKLFPPTLSWLTAGGVIGLYTTFVFLASRILRAQFSGSSSKIMYSELPYVDRILQLCLDIYLVRESLEFTLEEDLFAKLIFLYRSPETMIRWTRPAEEQSSDEENVSDIDETDAEKVLRKTTARPLLKS